MSSIFLIFLPYLPTERFMDGLLSSVDRLSSFTNVKIKTIYGSCCTKSYFVLIAAFVCFRLLFLENVPLVINLRHEEGK